MLKMQFIAGCHLVVAYLFHGVGAGVYTAGSYVVLDNYVIPSTEGSPLLQLDRRSDCERKCTEDPSCTQYSWIQRSPGVYCNMVGAYDDTMEYSQHPLGALAIHTGIGSRVMSDGNLYAVIQPSDEITDRGKGECEKLGFRLAVFDSSSLLESLMKYAQQYPEDMLSIDMEEVSGKAMWGGSTELSEEAKQMIGSSDYESTQYMYFGRKKFWKEKAGDTYPFLCQKIL